MELFIFGRFHARPGAEPGCLGINWFRSTRGPLLFSVHSRWFNEAAFGLHASLPHTVRFIERAEQLIEHALDVTRARLFT